MKGFQKFQDLKVALGAMNKFDKSSIHVTTNDFFFLKPAMCYEMIPKETLRVDMSTFARATPMTRPAYVDVDIVNHAFFVPYRTVWPQFTAFKEESKYDNVVPSRVPLFDTQNFFQFVLLDGTANLTISGSKQTFFKEYTPSGAADADANDVRFTDTNGNNHYFHMTRFGKQFIALLQALGYNFPVRLSSPTTGKIDNYKQFIRQMSALPLLSMLRVWYDYFMISNYDCTVAIEVGTTPTLYYEPSQFFVPSKFGSTAGTLTVMDLAALGFWLTMIPYEKDYYQVITKTPVVNGMNNGQAVNSGFEVDGQVVTDTVSPSVVFGGGNLGFENLDDSIVTGWIMNVVNRLTSFFGRNNVSGIRAIDRYLSRWGVQLSYEKMQEAVYIGKFEQKLDISAQMSTSATSGSPLADYAGKADSLPYEAAHFSYTTNEFGQFIIVSQFIPKSPNFQGLKREMLHIKNKDFFTPELDGLGYQGVPCGEVFNTGSQNEILTLTPPSGGTFNPNYDAHKLAGFLPRYAESKQGTDKNMLTGDFRFYTAGATSYESMQLFRLRPTGPSLANVVDRQHFIGSWDSSLDRIFANSDSFYDHFITYYTLNVTSYMPARKLFDILDDVDSEHNRSVKREVQGTQL